VQVDGYGCRRGLEGSFTSVSVATLARPVAVDEQAEYAFDQRSSATKPVACRRVGERPAPGLQEVLAVAQVELAAAPAGSAAWLERAPAGSAAWLERAGAADTVGEDGAARPQLARACDSPQGVFPSVAVAVAEEPRYPCGLAGAGAKTRG
jgi:hypothetical protein